MLLVTRDHDLMQRVVESSNPESLAIDYVEGLFQARRQLTMHGPVPVLAVDIGSLQNREDETLRELMHASNVPVLVVCEDDDPVAQARLLADGAQDVLPKHSLTGHGLQRAAQSAFARKVRETAGFETNNRALATLSCIGDAVLSTDSGWLVTFINPVAERLTGWTRAEAVGLHVSEVFQVLDGVTRTPTMHRMEMAIGAGSTIILPPTCILVRRNGQTLHIEDSAAPIHDARGEFAGMVVVFHDVSASRAQMQKMSHFAEHDELTALPNRALWNDRLEHGIALAHRHDCLMAVLVVNLDHFKHINDSIGHLHADSILREVAQRIISCIRQSDTASRRGGDEFAVLLSELHLAEDAGAIAEKIRLAVMAPYTIDSHYWRLTASIGISVYPDDGTTAFALTQHAETAMRHAKQVGRNNGQFFKADMNIRAKDRQIVMGDLRHALSRDEFFLVFQPKIDLNTGNITGFEALVRWRHPSRGVLSPTVFIPNAEDCGLIIPIGEWVLREACARARQWLDAGLKFKTVSVNVSAVEFRSECFFDGVCRILRTTRLEPRFLEVELTETAVMRDLEAASAILHALSDMGIRIAVDDFGTGYSNLSYLKRFPISTLKLDRSFIHDLADSADTTTIVSSVIRMAHELSLVVVGEGVETIQQLKLLKAHNCDEAQGFYFSKPLDVDECRSLLLQTTPGWLKEFTAPSLSTSN